jgi:hypothetical protein
MQDKLVREGQWCFSPAARKPGQPTQLDVLIELADALSHSRADAERALTCFHEAADLRMTVLDKDLLYDCEARLRMAMVVGRLGAVGDKIRMIEAVLVDQELMFQGDIHPTVAHTKILVSGRRHKSCSIFTWLYVG